jgi:hypothetical protein
MAMAHLQAALGAVGGCGHSDSLPGESRAEANQRLHLAAPMARYTAFLQRRSSRTWHCRYCGGMTTGMSNTDLTLLLGGTSEWLYLAANGCKTQTACGT